MPTIAAIWLGLLPSSDSRIARAFRVCLPSLECAASFARKWRSCSFNFRTNNGSCIIYPSKINFFQKEYQHIFIHCCNFFCKVLRYPEVAFLHVTVPVCSTPRTAERVLKESVRFLIGKPGVLDDNLKRQRYNSLLNQRYAEAEKVFELAFAESISLDGLRCYGTKGRERVYIMFPGYAHDGGHLNPIGRGKSGAVARNSR